MTMESQTRELPPLSLRASFRPETVNEEKRTVELVWTTGARVKRGGFWTEPYWEELSLKAEHVRLGRLNNGAPFLRDHGGKWGASVDDVLAVVESARLTSSEGTAVVRFPRAEDDPEADKVFRKVRDGILQNVSVGYRVHKLVKVEQSDGEIPVMRAEDWEPYEISLVAMGADDGAGVRSAGRDGMRPQMNPCEFVTRGVEPQKESKMPEEQKRTAETATPPPAVDVEKVLAEERQRAAEIHKLVERAKLGQDVARSLIEDGSSVDKARAVVLDKVVERSAEGGPSEAPSGARVEVGRTEKDVQRLRVSSWLIERAGYTGLIDKAKSKPPFARAFKGDIVIDPGEARGLSLKDLARGFLEGHKVDTRGMTPMELAGRALTFRSGPYQGTDSFPILFEDALRKILLAAYATQSDTWRLFCSTDTVQDFRPSYRYRTGVMGGTLDRLNEHGEFKNKAIPDGSKTAISTETRGNIIALTRQALVNDDMGALARTAADFGRLAGRTIESDVYALLAENSGLGPTMGDGNPFFHSSRGNVGTGSALTVDGLNADIVLMGSQKDQSGVDFIQLNPRTLVVPLTLRAQANVVNSSEFDPKDNSFRKPNSVRGMFSDIVGTPRMTGTRRYLFADPAGGAEAIKVVFLEGGGEGPVMEMEEGWRVDGTEWKIRMDMNVEPFDPKGAVTNAGA